MPSERGVWCRKEHVHICSTFLLLACTPMDALTVLYTYYPPAGVHLLHMHVPILLVLFKYHNFHRMFGCPRIMCRKPSWPFL